METQEEFYITIDALNGGIIPNSRDKRLEVPAMADNETTKVEKQENANPQTVVSQNGGEDDEPKFSAKQLTAILQERMKRQETKHQKALEELKKTATKPANASIDEEVKSKLTDFETQLKTANETITKYKTVTLQKTVSSALAVAECVDPDLVAKDLISSGRVLIDEETGEVVAESITGRVQVSDIVAEYAKKKPYLFKSQAKGGVGSRAPSGTSQPSRIEDLREQLQIKPQGNKSLFGR